MHMCIHVVLIQLLSDLQHPVSLLYAMRQTACHLRVSHHDSLATSSDATDVAAAASPTAKDQLGDLQFPRPLMSTATARSATRNLSDGRGPQCWTLCASSDLRASSFLDPAPCGTCLPTWTCVLRVHVLSHALTSTGAHSNSYIFVMVLTGPPDSLPFCKVSEL